ncbi:MAG: hypothetical protein JRG76_03835 [Deltaproteobacteria bacterium]|nr:hypothetical protein [Deltaproteobacteria bacterium]MBW2413620.1 hypothetical protein [Deltaproteobacteria bacterium]
MSPEREEPEPLHPSDSPDRHGIPEDTGPAPAPPRIAQAGLAAACLASIALLWWLAAFVTDDALITLRYARNLVEGHGIVWNPGEGPVEGYSNFLHLLIGAAAIAGDAPPLIVLRWLNRVAALGLVFATWLWALRTCQKPALAAGVALLLALNAPLAFWASSGLETALYTLSVTLGLYFALAAPPHVRVWAAAPFLVAALTRAEGPIFPLTVAIVTAGAAVWRQGGLRPGLGDFLREHAAWLLLFGVPYCAYFAWRVGYFGYLLPNSVYIKAVTQDPGVVDAEFLAWNAPLLLLALAAPYRRLGAKAVVPLLLIGIHLAMLYEVKVSVSYLERFFLPVIPGAIVLAVASLDRIASRFGRPGGEATARRAGLAAAALGLAGLVGWSLFHPQIGVDAAHRKIARLNHRMLNRVQVADWLSSRLEPDARITLPDVGTVAYLLPNPIDDAFGLNNVDYPHRFNHGRENYVMYLATRRPDAIVVTTMQPDRFVMKYVTDAWLRKVVLDQRYPRRARFLNPLDPYHYWVHVSATPQRLRPQRLPSLLPEPIDAQLFRVAELIEQTRRAIAARDRPR